MIRRAPRPGCLVVCLAGLLLASGCSTMQRLRDVSTEAPYRDLIGTQHRLSVAMHLSGVNTGPGYGSTVDHYTLNPTTVAWSGPELITRETLPPGTRFNVLSVQRCTNCPFEKIVQVEVALAPPQPPRRMPIRLNFRYLGAPWTEPVGSAP